METRVFLTSAELDLFTLLAGEPLSLEEAAAARHAGFFAFLRKPLELERLRQSVQQLIQTHFGGPLTFPGPIDLPCLRQPPYPRPPHR